MRLPGVEHAVIEPRKLRDYLLSTSHAGGRAKAVLFGRLGYGRDEWHAFAADLRRLAETEDATAGQLTAHGTKYVVRGTLAGPAGEAEIVTVWIILNDEDFPRFVTAYPE